MILASCVVTNSKARFSRRSFKVLPQKVSRMAIHSWNYPGDYLRWIFAHRTFTVRALGNTSDGVREGGPGRGQGWIVLWLQLRPQHPLQGALELGWPLECPELRQGGQAIVLPTSTAIGLGLSLGREQKIKQGSTLWGRACPAGKLSFGRAGLTENPSTHYIPQS